MINDADASKRRGILLRNIKILMSILQLLTIEVGKYGYNCKRHNANILILKTFNGGREMWQTHLRTASGPVSTVLQARLASMTTSEEPMTSHVEKGSMPRS